MKKMRAGFLNRSDLDPRNLLLGDSKIVICLIKFKHLVSYSETHSLHDFLISNGKLL